MEYLVNVAYPVSGMFGISTTLDAQLLKLAEAVQGLRISSATSCAKRELDMVFPSAQKAKAFQAAVRKLPRACKLTTTRKPWVPEPE